MRAFKLPIPVLIYVIALGGYLAASGSRLLRPSSDNHYVYLADSFLHGTLSMRTHPPHQNDWAQIIELTLTSGEKIRGTYLKLGGGDTFKTTRGEKRTITPEMIQSRRDVYYVSFPWFPAVLMMPLVAIFGMKMNDVLFSVALAAFNPVLIWFILQKLRQLQLSQRSTVEDLWLVGMFTFGTVHFFSAVIGQVWYTAHVVGVMLSGLYVLCALDVRRPAWAGLLLGLAFVTRPPLSLGFPLLLGEIWRVNKHGDYKKAFKQLLLAAVPAVAVLIVACVINHARFDNPTQFGHYYLNVVWAERIQRWGLINYHFLSRNLAVMLTLLPKIMPSYPYLQVSWHGVALWVTTPLFLYLLWPKNRSTTQLALYGAVLLPMGFNLLYQNSGWVQFGYRFALDYVVYLMALLAIGGRPLGRTAKTLIILGVVVNTFGAITFGRSWDFYWDGIFPVQ